MDNTEINQVIHSKDLGLLKWLKTKVALVTLMTLMTGPVVSSLTPTRDYTAEANAKYTANLVRENPFNGRNISINGQLILIDTEEALKILDDVIDKNIYLSAEDKEKQRLELDLVRDNPYANFETIYNALSKVNITYQKGFHPTDSSIGGTHSYPSEEIVVYNTTTTDKDVLDSVIQHEFGHQEGNFFDFYALTEGMNTKRSIDYWNHDEIDCGYYEAIELIDLFIRK